MKRSLPLAIAICIIASFGVRLYMTQLMGWYLFFEIPLLIISLIALLGLSIYLCVKKVNRFPVRIASCVAGLYLIACIFAGDISDETGVYYFGSFHSTDNGQSIIITERIAFLSVFARSFILVLLIAFYIYGASDKRERSSNDSDPDAKISRSN